MSADDLEMIMHSREQRTYEVRSRPEPKNKGVQTADKTASLFDFIKMVNKVVSKTMGHLNVQFIPDENKLIVEKADLKLDNPVITYKVLYRKPDGELKQRVRQEVIEDVSDPDEQRIGTIYGQKFDCLIQFNVFASVYDVAEEVMEEFEKQILTYTGFFKKNGVAEVLFSEQTTDSSYDMYRQTISVRNIRYRVKVEKLTAVFQETIKEVETLGL